MMNLVSICIFPINIHPKPVKRVAGGGSAYHISAFGKDQNRDGTAILQFP